MPPVRNEDENNSNNNGHNDDNNNNNNNNKKTNGENSDKGENEVEVPDEDKDKDKDSDKKLDEGFVSDGSEKKVSKVLNGKNSEKNGDKQVNGPTSPKRPIAQNIYENLPLSPKRHANGPPIQVLQQVQLSDATKPQLLDNEKRLAPAPKDIYGTFPTSPIKFSGPITPVQKLQTVSLQEAQREIERAKLEPTDGKELPKHETKILEQIHVSIPVQQLDIRAYVHVSQSPSPTRHRPTPSKPSPQTSLHPKTVKLEPIQSRSPSRSPQIPLQSHRISPQRSSQPSPRPSPVPSRSPSKERAPAPVPSSRPSRQDMPSRRELPKSTKDTPTISVSVESDKKVSKDKSPVQKTPRQPATQQKRHSIVQQSPGLLEMAQNFESMTSPSPVNKNKGPADFSHKLIALCRKGDWVGVDTVIKYAIKHSVEPELNVVSENSGWSPVMFAVKDNRIQIVEQLLDLGYPVNTKAKVLSISPIIFIVIFSS